MRSTLLTRRQLAVATALSLSSVLLLAVSASAVTIDWVSVGDAGNSCDNQSQGCFGGVAYDYQVAKFEVTNTQYAEFLNAVADTDTFGLYNANMANVNFGGIVQSGVSGFFQYTAVTGRENRAVNYISFYDALRFANWLQNGQPNTGSQTGATTEDGSYTFSGATTVGGRNAGATIFLPTEDEWYKAAYYDALSTSYLDFPAGSDVQSICAEPTATPNRANCFGSVGRATDAGAYSGSASPYGTFDQGGNVFEWTEAILGADRVKRGGEFLSSASELGAAVRSSDDPAADLEPNGFRLVNVPEPATGLLVIAGMLSLASWQRRCIRR